MEMHKCQNAGIERKEGWSVGTWEGSYLNVGMETHAGDKGKVVGNGKESTLNGSRKYS